MFKDVAEAFNHYKDKSINEIETRAQEIENLINTDPTIKIDELNIELDGLKEAKENIEERSKKNMDEKDLKTLEKGNFETRASDEAIKGDVFASAEYRNAFYKNLMGQTLTTNERNAFNRAMEEHRADAYSTSSDATAVLPTSTLNQVISKARTMGGIMAEARNFAMPTKISIPVATPSSKANWHTEGASVATEKPSLASVSFDGYEIIKIFSISVKVKTMSISAMESYLVEELTNCVLGCIADGLVNGTGSNQGKGVAKITYNASNKNLESVVETSLAYTNFTKVVSLLKRGYSAGAKWAMNNATLYNRVYGVVDGNNRPIFVADPQDGGKGKILGFDVVIDDNIADDEIYFGNFKYLGYNLPAGIVVESSRESSFKSGLIDYRAMAIADCKPIIDEAFVKLAITKATQNPSA